MQRVRGHLYLSSGVYLNWIKMRSRWQIAFLHWRNSSGNNSKPASCAGRLTAELNSDLNVTRQRTKNHINSLYEARLLNATFNSSPMLWDGRLYRYIIGFHSWPYIYIMGQFIHYWMLYKKTSGIRTDDKRCVLTRFTKLNFDIIHYLA